MKRIFITFNIFILIFGIVAISTNNDFINKVIYEFIEDYKKLSVDSEGETILTDEIIVQIKLDVDDFSEITNIDISNQDEYRKAAKEYYSTLNQEYLSTLNLTNFKSVYISKYSPYIEYTYQSDKYYNYKNSIAYTINGNEYVETAYVKENVVNQIGHLRDSLYCSGAYEHYFDPLYTGDGIKIGILEPGLVDGSLSCFREGQVTTFIQGEPLEAIHDHSTHMAAYIAGSEGIAPDAEIYSSYIWGTPSEELDWFLDNGVQLVNMSYGDASPTGVYASDSAYCDYIVNTYYITLVAAVGNTGNTNGYVSNPALGYNVIGVGACTENYEPELFSSYLEVSGPPKPLIMAEGYGVSLFDINIYNSGTSVSCAIVTGLIALLMEEYPLLQISPDQTMAQMIATSYQLPNAILMNNGLNEAAGGGVFRYDKFSEGLSDYNFIENPAGLAGNIIHSESIELTEGSLFKISLAWLAYANGNVERTKFTNYDLYLEDPNGDFVASAVSTNGNIEMFTYTVPEDGTYYIRIRQIGPVKNSFERMFVAWGEMPDYIEPRG